MAPATPEKSLCEERACANEALTEFGGDVCAGPGREASAHEEDGATLDSNGLDRRENTAQADADDFDDELFGTDDIDLEDGIDEEGEELGSQDAEADEGGEDAEARAALLGSLQSMLDQKKAEEAGGLSTMSAHERKVARMAERASKLEEENMGEKQWFLRGEARAGMPVRLINASSLHCSLQMKGVTAVHISLPFILFVL